MEIIDDDILAFEYDAKAVGSVVAAAKTCYQSPDRPYCNSEVSITEKNLDFIRNLINKEHDAMLEFTYVRFRVIVDRGVSHELVRHRIASFAQESTRYCDYNKKGIRFIRPYSFFDTGCKALLCRLIWYIGRKLDEWEYKLYRKLGKAPQFARCALPTCTKTEIVFQMNMREFRHFLKLRTSKHAHPDMRRLACKCRDIVMERLQLYPFIQDLCNNTDGKETENS